MSTKKGNASTPIADAGTNENINNKDLIAELKARVAELEAEKQKALEKKTADASEKIDPDEYIKVMSLLPYTLILSTKEGGQGSLKKFTKYGEIKRILYRDLVDIMETSPGFLEAGYYYILDPRVIRFHGLEDVYENILTKDKIKEIFTANPEESVALYETANKNQQKIIIELIIGEIVEKPGRINMNVIDALSRASGVDIYGKVKDTQTILEKTNNPE